MNTNITKLVLCSGLLALASLPSQAGVSFSIDGTTTTSSTVFPGTPALTFDNPNAGTSVDGNLVNAFVFQAQSSFNLGAIEFAGNIGTSQNNSVVLYDLGSSLAIPPSSGSTYYSITGGNVDLLSSGLNVNIQTSGQQFIQLSFSGVDQVSLNSGDFYALELDNNSGGANMLVARGADATTTEAFALGTALTGPRTEVPAGVRNPVAAIFAAGAVPEPSSMALLGLGALAGVYKLRRGK
jgi:PEP-CTERM motif